MIFWLGFGEAILNCMDYVLEGVEVVGFSLRGRKGSREERKVRSRPFANSAHP